MNSFRTFSTILLIFYLGLGNIEFAKAQPVEFGIIGGINISSHLNQFRFVDNDIDLNLSPEITMGYQAGLLVRKGLSRSLSLQISPSLILLGANYNEAFTLRGFELQTESRTELMYVQVPFLLNISTLPPHQTVYGRQKAVITYHLNGGIFGRYLLDAHFSGTNSGAPIGILFEETFSDDIKAQYSDYDGGAILGAGFEYGKIGLETRAYFSVISSGNAPDLSFDPQNMAVTLSAYYLF